MKCDHCIYLSGYTLGADECGAGNWLSYCAKDHWTDGEILEHGENPWEDCVDYKPEDVEE